jgi:hypothetical protein
LETSSLRKRKEMGIHGFFGNFLTSLGPQVVRKSLPPTGVEGVIFDLNGLLHSVAQKVFMYGDKVARKDYETAKASKKSDREYIEEYMVAIGTELSQIITALRPRQYVIICVDGVAPGAKIAQQRARRYKDFKGINPDTAPLGGFNSTFLSPGTPMMNTIDLYLRGWLKAAVATRRAIVSKKNSAERSVLPPTIVYSGHTINGEGEHKAFRYLKELLADFSIRQGNGSHVIYGMDADLAMLSLVSPVRNIMLSRENLSEIVSIEDLYTKLRLAMTKNGTAPSAGFLRETICRDFIAIATLIGNDFIPVTPSTSAAMIGKTLLETYATVGAPLTIVTAESLKEDPIAPAADISIAAFGNFCLAYSRKETELLKDIYNAEVRSQNTELERYPTRALAKAFDPKTQTLSMTEFRKNWYADAAEMYNATHPRAQPITSVGECIKSMATCYIAGIAWTLRYYTGGGSKVNWLYAYPFITAPTVSDMAALIIGHYPQVSASAKEPLFQDLVKVCALERCGGGFTHLDGLVIGRGKSAVAPAHQLLAITPPGLVELATGAPALSQMITDPDAPLFHIAPLPGTFETYKDGIEKRAKSKYKERPILPAVDLLEVVYAVEVAARNYKNVQEAQIAADWEDMKKGIKPMPKERINARGESVAAVRPKVHALVPGRLAVTGNDNPIVVEAPMGLRMSNARTLGKEKDLLALLRKEKYESPSDARRVTTWNVGSSPSVPRAISPMRVSRALPKN